MLYGFWCYVCNLDCFLNFADCSQIIQNALKCPQTVPNIRKHNPKRSQTFFMFQKCVNVSKSKQQMRENQQHNPSKQKRQTNVLQIPKIRRSSRRFQVLDYYDKSILQAKDVFPWSIHVLALGSY